MGSLWVDLIMDTFSLFVSVILPWTVNLVILLCFWCKAGSKADSKVPIPMFWLYTGLLWVLILILALSAAWNWTGDTNNSLDSLEWVLTKTANKVYETLSHVLRYIIPFAVYPLIVFWLKIWVYQIQNSQEQSGSKAPLKTATVQQHALQARLITFVIKVLILIFVFFDLLGQLDIQTDQVLQIGTVFSLGLSWSMRDWLSSLWASFMLSFTTELTCDSQITLGTDPAISPKAFLTVLRPGLIYTVCQKEDNLIFIPNSLLVNQGFQLSNMIIT